MTGATARVAAADVRPGHVARLPDGATARATGVHHRTDISRVGVTVTDLAAPGNRGLVRLHHLDETVTIDAEHAER